MKKIPVKPLDFQSFSKYGTYHDILHPCGCHLGGEPCEFYRDMGILTMSMGQNAGFSVTRVLPRPLQITELEYHDTTGEGMLPLDGDILLQVAPASGKGIVPAEELEVYKIPKGTLVLLRPGVWHGGPFADENSAVNILVVLPERTYAADCTIIPLQEDQITEIVR